MSSTLGEVIIYLTIKFCLISDPSQCTEIPIEESFPTPMKCALMAQLYVVDWLDKHPEYEIGEVLCSKDKPI